MNQVLYSSILLLKENQGVKSLSFKNKRLEQLPIDLSAFKNIEWLDLSGNNLKKLPEGLCNLKKLRVLYLSANNNMNWSQVLGVLVECPHLEKLNLANCNLKTIPAELCHLEKLKKLVLDNNPINVFSERNLMNLPCNLDSLSVLDCKESEISLRLKGFNKLSKVYTTSYQYDWIQQIHFLLPKAEVLIH